METETIYIATYESEILYAGKSLETAKTALKKAVEDYHGEDFDDTDEYYTDLSDDDYEIEIWQNEKKMKTLSYYQYNYLTNTEN